MIRRSVSGGLVLVPQPHHARLAGDLARVWGNDAIEALPERDQLVTAIDHHDDGWASWEKHPAIDPETGQPRDFLEMRIEDSTDIWTHSIERCFQDDPRGGAFVSLHFCDLGRGILENRRRDPETDPKAIENLEFFLHDQEARRKKWLSRIDPSYGPAHFEAEAEWGFQWVRFFDRLSLWICCDPFAGTREITTPQGLAIRCQWKEPHWLLVDPWPFSRERLAVETTGWHLDDTRWDDEKSFRKAWSKASKTDLRWDLTGK